MDKENNILALLNKEEVFGLLSRILIHLEDNYNIKPKEAIELTKTGDKSSRLFIPISIFSTKLSPAEAIVKYLKEQHYFTYKEIADLLNRDQRGIWTSYDRAKKRKQKFLKVKEDIYIPVSIYKNRNYSILEATIVHLHDIKEIKMSAIAKLLKKSPSTVWTAYNRAKSKQK